MFSDWNSSGLFVRAYSSGNRKHIVSKQLKMQFMWSAPPSPPPPLKMSFKTPVDLGLIEDGIHLKTGF